MSSYNARATVMNDRAATVRVQEAHVVSPAPSTPSPGPTALAYERFLEMPVDVVLVLPWLAGAALLGSCALVLYAVGSVLLHSTA
jgi:hypothetical protein